jgi:chromosome segregation ATPase
MTTLRSSDISASHEISEMKVQLETKEEQLKHWKTEANKYKSDLDAANQLNGEYKSEIESYKRSMMALRKEHKKIEERLKTEQETRQKAEQRIVEIWEQLQQTIGCERGQKRPASHAENISGVEQALKKRPSLIVKLRLPKQRVNKN